MYINPNEVELNYDIRGMLEDMQVESETAQKINLYLSLFMEKYPRYLEVETQILSPESGEIFLILPPLGDIVEYLEITFSLNVAHNRLFKIRKAYHDEMSGKNTFEPHKVLHVIDDLSPYMVDHDLDKLK